MLYPLALFYQKHLQKLFLPSTFHRKEEHAIMPQPFSLYNTLTKEIEPFVPLEEGKVRLYVCGMTVYDHIHVGHGRAMVVFDAFVRYLRYRGWDVKYVRNFTDVDDKIIKRANEKGIEPAVLAQNFIHHFHEDTDALGLIRPDQEPRVSTSISDIVDMTQTLIDKGHAYVAKGSVWFAVKSFDEYGKLSRQDVDQLRSADDGDGKNHPADFALWKAAKPTEPTWDAPFGAGRPGWHIECSAMAHSCLGEQIDIHGGGLDLVFPHHENEVAQSECASAKTFARYWMHNGLLTMSGGQKMGKSLGNVINIRDALQSYPAEAIRLYLLQNHYRSSLPWSSTALREALGKLLRLYEAKDVALQMNGTEKVEQLLSSYKEPAQNVWDLSQEFTAKFLASLDDDFNTAQALSHIFELARAVNRLGACKKAQKRAGPLVQPFLESLQIVEQALGILGAEPQEFETESKEKFLNELEISKEEIETSLEKRKQARADKDWALSDEIRDTLSSRGISVMDTPQGMNWKIQL